ncbi:putative sigma-54 modulation protein [Desulfohalotomaculum tongense]|uniref:ribosome hibernation-promoting factor, HPF/YfiA family n=1 Tax=Desulforadius tongensis TaxID=1216062 RepID=UPI00195B92E7|nr:ribosome-associated translation inhibitor RaiA [Desulforadius tongensis]MBM7853673.1 putative sigma-54 modulation protein [Desulforadius tongensis]
MKINTRGKNIELTPALKDYVEKRINKLEKFFDDLGDAQVTLLVEGDKQKVEVTIPIKVNGLILRGEESTGDMYTSIDLVVDKLEKQIEKYKGKLFERRQRGGNGKAVPKTAPAERENEPRVVKTKRFAVKPMSVDEAILQMNLLGHSFFVFSNADSEQVNVLYRRKDGHYGLIEPDFI